MKFSDLYFSIITLWPEEISIANGEIYNEGGYFPDLAKVHDEIEAHVGISDPWRSLMVWTLFQVFHAEARELFKGRTLNLNTRKVSSLTIEQRYHENLKLEDWRDLLPLYERM